MKAPCGECPNKGCGNHSNCEKYLEYATQCEEARQKNYNEKMIDGYSVGVVLKSKRNYLRRKG